MQITHETTLATTFKEQRNHHKEEEEVTLQKHSEMTESSFGLFNIGIQHHNTIKITEKHKKHGMSLQLIQQLTCK